MPGQASNDNEPPLMTWGRAAPKLLVAGFFDLVRLIFDFFWIFGPVLFTIGLTGVLSQYIGTWLAGIISGLTGLAVGYGAAVVFAAIGTVLAFAVGLFGWGVMLLWLYMTNKRIFDSSLSHRVLVIFGWLFSEVPIVGGLPMMTLTIWRMYHNEIKTDRVAHKAWQKRKAASDARAQEERMALIRGQRQAREVQAANVNEIPERPRLVA